MHYLISSCMQNICPNPSLETELNFLGSNNIINAACIPSAVFSIFYLKHHGNVKAIEFVAYSNTFYQII